MGCVKLERRRLERAPPRLALKLGRLATRTGASRADVWGQRICGCAFHLDRAGCLPGAGPIAGPISGPKPPATCRQLHSLWRLFGGLCNSLATTVDALSNYP